MFKIQIAVSLAMLVLWGGTMAAKIDRNLEILAANEELDNILEPNGMKRFVHILNRPPTTMFLKAGHPLVLRCEVMGSPAPVVQWLKNDAPILGHDQVNELLEGSDTSIARVEASVIVSPSSGHEHGDVYTCIARAQHNLATHSITVYSNGEKSDASNNYKIDSLKPHIVYHYSVYMDAMGGNAVMPCKSDGHPRAVVEWIDANGKKITKENSRMKVLKTGELLVTNLHWSDMGEFTCVITNAFGKDKVSTFLYPYKIY